MPVRIRLQRLGRKNHPFFRIVAADSRSPRDGRHLEVLGSYNPLPNPATKNKEILLRAERIKYWLSVGAQPSSKVAWICGKAGVLPPLPQRIATTTSSKTKKKEEEGKSKTSGGGAVGAKPSGASAGPPAASGGKPANSGGGDKKAAPSTAATSAKAT